MNLYVSMEISKHKFNEHIYFQHHFYSSTDQITHFFFSSLADHSTS
jgi:hypothetical protein